MIYVFDMFGVVLDWGSEYVMSDWAKAANVDEKKFRDRSSKEFDLAETGKISMENFWADLGRKFDCSPRNLEKLLEKRFSEQAKLNTGVVKIIDDLKNAGYQVVLFSNQLPVIGGWCRGKGWFDRFDRVFLSYELGYMKPSPEAYRSVAEALKVRPDELFLVDDRVANVSAAVGVGWNGLVFTNDVQLEKDLQSLYPAKMVKKSDAA